MVPESELIDTVLLAVEKQLTVNGVAARAIMVDSKDMQERPRSASASLV